MADLTIIMPTWNKAKYIREALDSVFGQKTSHSYHIIVADDCSTDGTLDIVAEYERAHPGAFTVLRSERNQKLYRNIVRAYAITKTPYFCVLDPDDYWCSRSKIQRALDFLEAHPNFTVYAGNSLLVGPDGSRPLVSVRREVDCDFDDYVAGRGILGQTAGAVYRNVIFAEGLPAGMRGTLRPDQEMTFRGDAFRNFIHLHEGRAHFDPRCDAVYRVTEEGLWQGMSESGRQLRNVLLFLNLDEYFGHRHDELLYRALSLFASADGGTAEDAAFRHQLSLRLAEASRDRRLTNRLLVTVLMPAYNHVRYVETAIRSVLAQDWPRIELLVVDDGSSDGTWDVLERLRPECEARLERVTITRQENRGTCETMNGLCARATGEFVGILASDDAYFPQTLFALLRPMLRDASVGVTIGQNEFMDADGNRCFWNGEKQSVPEEKAVYRTFNEYLRKRLRLAADGSDYGCYSKLLEANHIANGALIRKSALDQTQPFRRDAPLEDLWLHLQLSKVTAYREVAETTFRYRWHAGNTVRQHTWMKELTDRTYRTEEQLLFARGDVRRLRQYLRARGTVCAKFGGAFFGRRVIDTPFSRFVEWRFMGLRRYVRRESDRVLVVAHVFYPRLWPELKACLANIGAPRDIVITYIDEASVDQARKDLPEAKFVRCENRGYDVWPFLKVLQEVNRRDYGYVVKVHTKRDVPTDWVVNNAYLGGPVWRRLALGFISTPKAWCRTLRALRRPEVGMVADRRLIFVRETTDASHFPDFDLACEDICRMTGLMVSDGQYVAGTMFAAKMTALEPILSKPHSADDFEPSSGHGAVTRAHILEREFGLAVEAAGLKVEGFDGSVAWRRRYYDRRDKLGAVLRFLLRKRDGEHFTEYRILKLITLRFRDVSDLLPYCLVERYLRRREGTVAYFRWAKTNRLKYGLKYWLPHRIVREMLAARLRRLRHSDTRVVASTPKSGLLSATRDEIVARIVSERDDARACRRDARILVCLHLFYPDLWPVVRAYLENLSPYHWDLLVTYPEGMLPASALEAVKAFKGHVRFAPCRNAGYDIGPFVEALRQVDLNGYDIVFKLQTKGCHRARLFMYDQLFKGADWFLNLYDGLLGGRAVHEAISSLLSGEYLLAAAENLVVSDPRHKRELVKNFCNRRSWPYVKDYRFVAGTCFAVRPEVLAPLKDLGLSLDDFADTVRGDFSLAHALERWMCFAAAGRIRGIPTDHHVYSDEVDACRSVSSLRLLEDDRFDLDAEFFYRILERKPVVSYEVVDVRLGDICRIWEDGRAHSLSECAPYRYLDGDGEGYDRYCAENAKIFGFAMSRARYDDLMRSMETFDPRKMPVVYGDANVILDGQHRSCILLKRFGPDYQIKVVRIR